ncbi:MAG: phosphatase PAP2 family protein [Clostridia bacterium]|nr:phosphatase PAP2 family protein [Clostridia bacterium]
METLKKNKKNILGIALFVLIFGALVVIASFFDFQISEILAKSGLENGDRYISSNAFGLVFEAIGSCAIYLMASVACCILFWNVLRRVKKDWLKYILAIVFAIGVFAGFYLTVSDIFKYVGEFIAQETGAHGVLDNLYITFLTVVIAFPPAIGTLYLWGKVDAETNAKMLPWILVIVGTAACYLIIHFVKSPIGRARYRAILAYNANPTYYDALLTQKLGVDTTSVINGETLSFRNFWVNYGSLSDKFEAIGIDDKYKEVLAEVGLASDICKSFPSGHTFTAGLSYTLICIPDMVDKFKTKGWKAFWYALPIVITGVVGLSRVVMGAHYLSDVLFGGTIAFLAVCIFRWLVLLGGWKKIAKLFTKKQKETPEVAEEKVEAEISE